MSGKEREAAGRALFEDFKAVVIQRPISRRCVEGQNIFRYGRCPGDYKDWPRFNHYFQTISANGDSSTLVVWHKYTLTAVASILAVPVKSSKSSSHVCHVAMYLPYHSFAMAVLGYLLYIRISAVMREVPSIKNW